MLRVLFGLFILLLAVSPWAYIYLGGGMGGSNPELEQRKQQLEQEALMARNKINDLEDNIVSMENELQASRSTAFFLEENIVKAEGRMNAALNDTETLNDQIKELRASMAELENELLQETNRANQFELENEELKTQLQSALQEIRKYQTLLRTLSNN